MYIATLVNNLKAKGYDVEVFKTKQDAKVYIDSAIDKKTVGIGGSTSVNELGIYDELIRHNTVYWHDRLPYGKTKDEVRRKASSSEVYISSVNAITKDGEIVNIDNTGNRIAGISFGPKDVYLIVGQNKITADLKSAIERAMNIAAPLNAQRLGIRTPCAINGDKCYRCDSPDSICRELAIFLKMPMGARYHIVIVLEDLGY